MSTIDTLDSRAHLAELIALDKSTLPADGGTRFNRLIFARERTAAGALSPIQRLSAAGQDGQDQDLDITGNGRAVVTWTQLIGQAGDRSAVIEARERTAAGALRATQILSDPGDEGFGSHVAFGGGNAVVAWSGDDGTNNIVQGAVGP